MTTPDQPTPAPAQVLERIENTLGEFNGPYWCVDDEALQELLSAAANALRAQAAALAEREAECERLRSAVANVEELAREWRDQAWANDAAGAPKSAADKAISPTLKVCVYRLNKALIPTQEAPND